ncbi:MAG: (deoxy)nucleoside triphosphate pyrophosphohydrolase [Lentisphaeria bacterium]
MHNNTLKTGVANSLSDENKALRPQVTTPKDKLVEVCAAVIRRDNKYLMAQRPADKHLGGKWEFPGGKIHNGETLTQCIAREIREELCLSITSPKYLATTEYAYPEKTVRLHFIQCAIAGDAVYKVREHQEVAWFTVGEIQNLDLPAADRPFVEQLAGLGQAPATTPHKNYSEDAETA